jgi:ABC-type sugar transport system substrate-binding protein
LAGLERVQAKRAYRVGYSFPHFRDTYWIGIGYGIEAEAALAGATVVRALEAGGYANLDVQIRHVEDMVQLGVDAIIIGPVDRVGLAPAIEAACKAGVKVIFAGAVASSECADVGVDLPNKPFGENAAKFICERLQGKGGVVMLPGPQGASWALTREETFKKVLAETCPEVKILDEQWTDVDRLAGQRVMEDWLQRFGDEVDAVFASVNLLAEGAVTALRAAGRAGKVVVVTSNFGKDALEMLKAGEIAAISEEPAVLIGRWGFNYAVRALNGDTTFPNAGPPEDGLPLPRNVVYPPIGFFTSDKVDTFDPYLYNWAPDGWVPGSGVQQ